MDGGTCHQALLQHPSALEIGASIRKELAVQIPTYMLPRKVHVVEQLPLTPNGKTDRRALAASLQAPSA